MRKLRYYESKLLKKVDFFNWPECDKDLPVLHRYHIQKRADYVKYNKLSREIREIARLVSELDGKDPQRLMFTCKLLENCYGMGLINTKNSLALCNEVNASSFCRRRLPIVMLKLNMAQNAKAAVGLVEHGHVRVGLDVVRDPAYIVTREMEDYISWSNKSKIKEKKLEYEQNRDDYDAVE